MGSSSGIHRKVTVDGTSSAIVTDAAGVPAMRSSTYRAAANACGCASLASVASIRAIAAPTRSSARSEIRALRALPLNISAEVAPTPGARPAPFAGPPMPSPPAGMPVQALQASIGGA